MRTVRNEMKKPVAALSEVALNDGREGLVSKQVERHDWRLSNPRNRRGGDPSLKEGKWA
jgi:hypothetical protein